MAGKSASNLVSAQAKLLGAFQSSELRYTYPATYLALKAMSPVMFPNYLDLKTREDRAVVANYVTRASRSSLQNARTHNHAGNPQGSATLTPSWLTYSDKFAMSLKQADTNLYSLDEQLFQEISNAIANLMEAYEVLAVNAIFDTRTTTGTTSTAEATFNATYSAFTITTANINRAMQITKVAMAANKYPNGYTVFCDSTSYALFEYQAAQGISNSTNLSFQFNGVTFVHCVSLGAKATTLLTTTTKGFWIVVPNGTAAVLPWIPKQNRIGVDTPVANYSNIINPIDGEAYAVHTYMTAAGATGMSSVDLNGYSQDVVTQYELSQDIVFAFAPQTSGSAVLAFYIS